MGFIGIILFIVAVLAGAGGAGFGWVFGLMILAVVFLGAGVYYRC